jgi:hypothetical protein
VAPSEFQSHVSLSGFYFCPNFRLAALRLRTLNLITMRTALAGVAAAK